MQPFTDETPIPKGREIVMKRSHIGFRPSKFQLDVSDFQSSFLGGKLSKIGVVYDCVAVRRFGAYGAKYDAIGISRNVIYGSRPYRRRRFRRPFIFAPNRIYKPPRMRRPR